MISVIANFYNSAPFIPRLMESMFAQTCSDRELICVDDCSPSPDDLRLLRRYEADPRARGRIRVVHLDSNVGISQAKHIGISHARGKWITFIDGDDRLRPRALESLVTPAEEHDLDMVIGNCRRVYEIPGLHLPFRSVPLRSRAPYGKVIEREEIHDNYLRAFFGDNFLSSYAYWGKLYRADTLRRSAYVVPSVTLYEDIFFVMHAMLVSSRIMFVPYEGYMWRWGGLSSGSSLKERSSVTDFGPLRVGRHFNDFYASRIAIMEHHSIPGVRPLLLGELRDVLWSAFTQCARHTPGSPGAIEMEGAIRDIISLPAYRDLSLLPPGRIDADPFLRAVTGGDTATIYSLAYKGYRRALPKRIIKRLLS